MDIINAGVKVIALEKKKEQAKIMKKFKNECEKNIF